MATQAYYAWDRAGRPWEVAAPIKAVGGRLQAHGYTVYYIGSDDRAHLQADVPEDHCPFSVTGWPGKHPYPYVLAMDIMPPEPGARSKIDGLPLPSLQQISAQMRADKIAGHPGMAWLKYMNWEPDRNNGGACWHDSWQPDYARWASGDRGHTHMSGRTDYVTSTAANGYDPVARLRGEDDDMSQQAEQDIADVRAMLYQMFANWAPSEQDYASARGIAEVRRRIGANAFTAVLGGIAANAAANRAEDRAQTAAIVALTDALNKALGGAGGDLDAAPILAAIADAKASVHNEVTAALERMAAAAQAQAQALAADAPANG